MASTAFTTLITGGTGFLGRHLIEALLARGGGEAGPLRVLARRASAELEARGVECVEGAIQDEDAVARALEGVRRVYHLAGPVVRATEDASERLFRTHVDGTRNLLRAAVESGTVARVVHVSSSGTVGVSRDPKQVATEQSPYAIELARRWPYYLAKTYAEKTALEHARSGKPPEVVVVLPSLLLGPGDEALSSTEDVLRFLRREIPATPPGGLALVDVRDAAAGLVAAMERGRAGERYLLNAANLPISTFFEMLEKVSGVSRPPLFVPRGRLAEISATALSSVERLLGLKGGESIAFDMACHHWYVDARKARAELGFAPRPAEQTLRDTVEWLRDQVGLAPELGAMSLFTRPLNRLLGR